jgi:hypothetical protein
LIQYKPGGGKVPHEDYLKTYAELIGRDEWIIDGCFGLGTLRRGRYADLSRPAALDPLLVGDQALSQSVRGSEGMAKE